ncbi:MAG: response regulator transcription factor [Clostridia bacterium]|nr:response regulator transcription factor [Clostridia bacterium]
MRVLIVDDSRQSRFYMQSIIAENSAAFQLVAAIESAANAEMYCVRGLVDMILMDVCTADNASGLAAAEKIKRRFPEIAVIMVTSMPEHSFIKKAREAGCEGFWYKEYGDTELSEVMARVAAGETVYPASSPAVRIGIASSGEFSDREYEIIRLLSEGCSRQEVADKLFISPRTVRFYIEEMKSKTGYTDTMRMVSDFIENKLIINNIK